jgi:hypothetical protein
MGDSYVGYVTPNERLTNNAPYGELSQLPHRFHNWIANIDNQQLIRRVRRFVIFGTALAVLRAHQHGT